MASSWDVDFEAATGSLLANATLAALHACGAPEQVTTHEHFSAARDECYESKEKSPHDSIVIRRVSEVRVCVFPLLHGTYVRVCVMDGTRRASNQHRALLSTGAHVLN